MWRKEAYNLQSIGVEGTYTLEQIPSIPIDTLPIYKEKTSELITATGAVRTKFSQQKAVAQGSYGNLLLTLRDQKTVLLKQPKMAEMNLLQEAVLQSIAQKTAEKEGFGWCVPKVYDIFWRNEKVWFSMDYIQGIPILDYVEKSQSTDRDFLLILAQISLLIWCLESNLGLDHRDLKLDNLLIKPQQSEIHLKIHDHVWTLVAPFSLVILDFGFACLGSKELRGKPIVNLGDGVLPPMDPCPKEGRDLFQLLASFLRFESFTQKISEPLHKQIDEWLSIGKKSYGPMARRWSTENWTYLVASQRDFAIPACCPLNILKSIQPQLQGYLSYK